VFKIATDSNDELEQDRLMAKNAIWQCKKSRIVCLSIPYRHK